MKYFQNHEIFFKIMFIFLWRRLNCVKISCVSVSWCCRSDTPSYLVSNRQSTYPGTRSASTAPPASASPPPSSPGCSTTRWWTGGWWPPTFPHQTVRVWRVQHWLSTFLFFRNIFEDRNRNCGPRARLTCREYTGWRYPWSGHCCWGLWPEGGGSVKLTKIFNTRKIFQVAISPGRLVHHQQCSWSEILSVDSDTHSDIHKYKSFILRNLLNLDALIKWWFLNKRSVHRKSWLLHLWLVSSVYEQFYGIKTKITELDSVL